MPRKERITEPGFYHVVSRGVERRNIFLTRSQLLVGMKSRRYEDNAYNSS
jgi:hypothetical protein